MNTTQLTPDADKASAVEQAIGAYLAQKPYSSRFKARDLANETPLQATTNEIAPTLSEMADNGDLEKISYSAGASTYRPTDDSQFDDQSMSTNTDERGDVIDLSPEFWPEHIDHDDVSTHLQRCIIQTATIHDDWTQAEIAEHLDCAPDTVSRTLTYYWPEHHTRQVGTETALSITEVEEIRRRLAGDETPPELVDEFDVALQTIRDAAKGKYDYTHAAEHPPLTYDRLTDEWVVDNSDREGER